MSGLTIKITAILLVNIVMVHGKKYLKHSYHVLYSDVSSSDSNEDAAISANSLMDILDWFRRHSSDNDDHVQRSEYRRGVRWPGDSGLPDWFPRLSDDNNRGNEKPGSGHRHPGDNSDCQNIKGLPAPESGCCGVQLKDFPSEWWSPRNPRFRRSMNSNQKPDQMIIDGMPTKIHQLPWMAYILIDSYVPDFGTIKSCGGSIISSRYVLTAAHCMYNKFKALRQVKVSLSEYDTSTVQDCVAGHCIRNVVMQVDNVVIHPSFNHTHLQNDIALLRLKSEIPYTDFMRPICLPNTDIKYLSDKPIIIAGWGYTGVEVSKVKRAAFVNYVKDDVCRSHYSYKDAGMFCSIGGSGEDICYGDSGGPLMVMNDDRFFLSGVVNGKRHGLECGSSLPSLFSNVFYHLEWIKKNVE